MKFKNNADTGRKGESIAKEYLISKGCKIIDTNWHYSKNAEIDIIAEDNGCLIFVEVKTRTNTNYGHPFEAIDQRKIQKIRTAVLAYLQNTSNKFKSYRIDGIAIIGLNNPIIEHIKNLGQF